jgi:hypothetical protein
VLRSDQIKNGFIETTQRKTNGTVIIPVHDTVKTALSKYNGSYYQGIFVYASTHRY